MSSINAYSLSNNYNFVSSMFNTNNSNNQNSASMFSVISQFSDYKVLLTIGNRAIGNLINDPNSDIKLPDIPTDDDDSIDGDTPSMDVPITPLPAPIKDKTDDGGEELSASKAKSYPSRITRDDTGITSLDMYL